MKYPNLELGTIEAVFNKLGGEKGAQGFLRGDVFFKDGSRLHFRKLVTTDPRVQRVSYTYHYMRADETLLFRYDDSDHFPKLSTAPHHKYIGENDVAAADIP